MFGNGEAPPTATIAPTKGVGPVLDRLWSRAPRAGGGGLVPTRPVPTSSPYPRPQRPLGGPWRDITDSIVQKAFGEWGYAGAAGALAFSFVVGFLFGRSTR